MILIRTLVSRVSCLKMRLLSCCRIIVCNTYSSTKRRVRTYRCTVSLSLSLSRARALSRRQRCVSVCKVCQGPLPHSAIPFSKLKVKSNRLCGYTSYINVMNISVALGGKGRDSSLCYAYENSKYLNRMFNFKHFNTILGTSF